MDRSQAGRRLLAWGALPGIALAAFLGAALLPTGSASSIEEPSACGPGASGERRNLVVWVNDTRVEAGLEPLLADPRLCAIAQVRAEEMAAAASVQSDSQSIQSVSRRLLRSGYEAHRWTERAILGYDPPVRMAERWSLAPETAMRDTVLGPFEEVGVGVAEGPGGTAISLLFAVPRLSELLRVSEPLADLDEVRAQALRRVNEARRSAGRPPVEPAPLLDAAAQLYAEEMFRRGFYGHLSPERKTPADRARAVGYHYAFLAENIAKGLFEPEEVVERWLDSRHHRDNILHREAVETGLGVAFGDTEDGFQVVWVQMFGRRR